MLILNLIQNVALLVTLALLYEIVQRRWNRQSAGYRVIAGLLFGGVGMIGMMTPVTFAPGIIYDGRSVILSIAGLFGGPLVAGIAALLCALYRLILGGAGAPIGVGVIVESAALGVCLYYLRRQDKRWTHPLSLWVFGVLVHVGMLGIQLLLPGGAGRAVVAQVGPTVLLVYPVATMLVCQVFLDSERRLRTERSLRESEERFRRLIQLAPIPMLFVNESRDILYINDRFTRTFGYAPEEVPTAEHWWRLAYPDPEYRRWVMETWEGVTKAAAEHKRDVEPIEYRVTCKDGTVRTVEISGIVIDGSLLATFIDVTARRRAEQAVADEATRRRVLFEQAKDGIVVLDKNLKVVEANPSFASMLGYTREEMSELHCWDWDSIYTSREAFHATWPELPATSGTIETRHRRKDGSLYDVEVTWNPAQWGGERHLFCVSRDIAERKEAETERQRLQLQLHHAQKLESIGRLAGGVAHDFNNMLQSILGFNDLALEEAEPDSDLHDHLTEIRKAAQRSADLTRQLLAFARKQTASPVSLDLNAAVPGTIKMLRRLIGEGIEINWSPGNGLGNVRIDPTQLDQILTNLTLNARDALDGEGRIDIETHSAVIDEDYCGKNAEAVPGDYIVLVVSDNGCGMDKHTAAHLFEPFYTTKQLGEGTGLGLPTVYGIVKQNAGFINVYSEPGTGTTFRIHLPRTAEQNSPSPPSDSKTPPRGNETILLVEDEPMILSLAQRLLESLGYKVLAAGDSAEALLLANDDTCRIDLVMTDVVMPGLNGRELATQIVRMKPGVKCLYMSGYTANIIAHHGVLDEGVHFIQKPFSVRELGAKVRAVLDS